MSPNPPTLDFALQYRARGFSIIATVPKTKKAAGKWKQYQERPADEPQIRKWFSNGKDYGVAIVLDKSQGGWPAEIMTIKQHTTDGQQHIPILR